MADASAARLRWREHVRGLLLLAAAAVWCLVSGLVVVAYYSGLLSDMLRRLVANG